MTDEEWKEKIAEHLGSIDAKLDGINKGNHQLMLALIGVIAASVGMKLVNSPPWIIISTYAAFFSATFVLCSLFYNWKKIHWRRRVLRLMFPLLVLFSTIVRITVFETGGLLPPPWFSPTVDWLYTAICGIMVWTIWQDQI